MSIDLDTLIANHETKIQDFIYLGKSLHICRDINGINAGVFILKNNEWADDFIQFVLSYEGQMDCEQNAIDHYMEKWPHDEQIKILPHPSINSYPMDYYAPSYGKIGYKRGDIVERPEHEEGDFECGDFICHVPGHTIPKRLEILKSIKIIK